MNFWWLMRFVHTPDDRADPSFSHSIPLAGPPVSRAVLVFVTGGLLTWVSITWIDRPLARMIGHALPPGSTAPNIPDLLAQIVGAIAVTALLVSWWARRRAYYRLAHTSLLVTIGAVTSFGLKSLAKWIFGRSETRLYLSAPHYAGFHHWFHGYGPFGGFPSGHLMVATTLVTLVTACYPRLRPWGAAALVLLAIALLLTSYHFLGDAIAGWVLGQSLAWVMLWTDAALRRRRFSGTPT